MKRISIIPGISSAPMRAGFLLASALPLCIATAQAAEFDLSDGEIKGRFDNTLSYGVAFRTQGADHNLAAETTSASPYAELTARNIRTAANKNDGNTNFADAGDIVSNTVKLNSLIEMTWKNFGVQASGFAFYDKALADIEGTTGSSADFINNVNELDIFDNERLPEDTADYAVSDVRLSSAYIWGDFEIGSRTLNVRAGEQVLSWGEALFMQDGINQANPADLSALRLPGAEVKDALLPLPMLVVSTNITESLSTEAFAAFGWDRSEADPVGTFYSTTDAFFGYGSEAVIIENPAFAGYNAFYGRAANGSRISINKTADHEPDQEGQYGLALRYLAESLNNSEFGLFFMNYHARKPTAGAVLGRSDTGNAGLDAAGYLDSTTYFLKYEDNLQVYGFTFSTNVGETSFSGEVAYRPDATFLPEVGDNLIAYAQVAAALGIGSGAPIPVAAFGSHVRTVDGSATLTEGEELDLTADEDMMNVSLVTIHNFGPTLGMDGLTGVAELGGAWVMGIDDDLKAGIDYAAEGALGYVPAAGLLEGNRKQYLDQFAWGYRLVLVAEFNDVAAGLNLKPQIRFAHDVDGNGVVGGNFMEERKSATVALNAEYAGNWTFGVGANAFWGRDELNEGNQLADRDNVFANVKYSF